MKPLFSFLVVVFALWGCGKKPAKEVVIPNPFVFEIARTVEGTPRAEFVKKLEAAGLGGRFVSVGFYNANGMFRTTKGIGGGQALTGVVTYELNVLLEDNIWVCTMRDFKHDIGGYLVSDLPAGGLTKEQWIEIKKQTAEQSEALLSSLEDQLD